MTIQTIAIISPGDMGHAVGRVLRENGFDVVACLSGRSDRTRHLSEKAGLRNIPDMDALVRETDLVLSILVPSEALPSARRLAESIGRAGSSPFYADCNAVSPATVKEIDGVITGAGGRFIDAGIIGNPPGSGATPRFYVSGPHAGVMTALNDRGINVRELGQDIGRASGMKMLYASLTKGTAALNAAALMAAEALGLSQELATELEESQSQRFRAMQSVTGLSAKALRWVGEMEEIAATYAGAGMPPSFHLGAAEVFRLIAESPIGHERPETIDPHRSLAETVSILTGYAMTLKKQTPEG